MSIIKYIITFEWVLGIIRFGYRIQGIENNFTWEEAFTPPDCVTGLQRLAAITLPTTLGFIYVIIDLLWTGI